MASGSNFKQAHRTSSRRLPQPRGLRYCRRRRCHHRYTRGRRCGPLPAPPRPAAGAAAATA